MTKGHACIIGLCMIGFFGGLSFIWPDRATHLNTIMTAIGLLTGGYFAIQMADNGVRGKYFNKSLYDAENTEENKQ